MAEPNFRTLRSLLLKGGVSPRRVRRLLEELRAHTSDLCAEQERDGLDKPAALQAAVRRLGTEESLAQQMLSRRELLTWSRRWPWAVYGIAPPVLCFGAFVLTIAAAGGLGDVLHALQHSEPVEFLDLLRPMRWVALYGTPAIVAACMTLLSIRRHAPFMWGALSLGLAALLGSTTNMSVSLHLIQAGIGWSFRPSVLGHLLLYRWLPIVAAASLWVGIDHLLRRRRATDGLVG